MLFVPNSTVERLSLAAMFTLAVVTCAVADQFADDTNVYYINGSIASCRARFHPMDYFLLFCDCVCSGPFLVAKIGSGFQGSTKEGQMYRGDPYCRAFC